MYLLVPLQKTMVILEMSNVQQKVQTNGANLITCQDLEALKKARIIHLLFYSLSFWDMVLRRR